MLISIHTKRKTYGVEIQTTRVFDLARLGLEASSWVAEMLVQLADRSLSSLPHDTQVTHLHNALGILSSRVRWLAFANQRGASLNVSVVANGFRLMEDELRAVGIAATMQRAHSGQLRQFAIRHFRTLGIPRIERIKSYFRSSVPRSVQRPRQLISDEITGVQPPISALSHSSVKDLREKVRERLELDFRLISAACATEFSEFERLSSYCSNLLQQEVDDVVWGWVERSARGQQLTAVERRHFQLATTRELEIAYVKVLHTALAVGARTADKLIVRRSGPLVDRITNGAQLTVLGGGMPQLVRASSVGAFGTVIAAFLIIKMRAGWNVGAVLELTENDVERVRDGFRVQGFKSKTDDFTPEWIARDGDEIASRAIEFLLGRLKKMREFGWVQGLGHSLWLSPPARPGDRVQMYRGWSLALRSFCDRHGLRRFSAEQVRNQALAIESLKVGGLEASRRVAGHVRLKTTAQYVDQLILQRLNSAVNLEFQRKLESSVEFRIDSSQLRPEERNDDLLYSVGDGSSCANPHSAPRADMALNGVCRGHECHAEAGCPNRKIVVNSDRVEELVRTIAFYERHWKRLLDENEDLFRVSHFPRFMFVMALEGIVRRSPYRSFLKAATDALNGRLNEQ